MSKKTLMAMCLVSLTTLAGCSNNENVIATVGDRDITEPEFQAYLEFKRIPQQDQQRVDRALDDYIQRAALAEAVERSGQLDQNLVEAEVEAFRRQLLISRHFENHLRDSVDDQAVQNYYANNAEQYESESIHAAHILIRVDTRMSEAEREAKRTIAQEAYSRLRSGEEFSEVAKEYSEDKVSAEKGGDLSWVRRGAVDPEFSKRLFDLESGEVSEPFLTPFGFHIVKMIDGPQTVKRPLESVSGDIRYQLRNEVKQAETERLLDTVKVSR